MRAPAYLELQGDDAAFRPVGTLTLEEVVETIAQAIAFCRSAGVQRLLVDTTGIAGLGPPTLAERFFLAKTWAEAAGGAVRFALVVRPELSDPRRFGATVATNRGADTQSFDTEAEALVWLHRPQSSPLRP